jgi:heterodisulfide reductase subunit B
LGITLIEPDGWVCCGSSAAHRADPPTALRLPLENLSGIEKLGLSEVTMPCAACFSRHKSAQCEIQDHVHEKTAEAVHVSTLIETIHAHAGLEGVADRVRRTLKGLRVACYYGCLLTRPPRVTGAEHPENPRDMDELMSALGMEVVDWSYKTACCGATHSLTRREIALELSRTLIEHAREAGAEMIAVACPLCHTNLDARQLQMNLGKPMPVLYFTQLMALAFGLSEGAMGLRRNLVDPAPLLRSKGLLG